MAIAVEVSFYGPGATLENYNKSIALLGATPGGHHPASGCLFHWVTEADGGLEVIDVWKTKQELETFAAEKLAPVVEELGIPKPEIKFVDVANYETAGT